jgi:HSP20 family protein
MAPRLLLKRSGECLAPLSRGEAEEESMRAMAPWTGMTNLRQELDRFFGPFGELKLDEFPALGDWAPNVDVSETTEALVVKAEVPGLDPRDIQISLQEQYLTIKGEKREEKAEKDERYHRVERTYGTFARSVRLPVGVDGSKVTAAFKNGLLTVTLPKTPAAKGTTIPIKED